MRLALVAALAIAGCAGRVCRDEFGRFANCAAAKWDAKYLREHGHGEPVGADIGEPGAAGFDRNGFRCRDAAGRTWPSNGECD